MTTWKALDTRRGRLIEMASAMSNANSTLQAVLDDFPEEVVESGDLERALGLVRAIGLVGQLVRDFDDVAEEMER